MTKRDRAIMALILIVIILGFMGYIAYLRVVYDFILEPGLGIMAALLGYMFRWILTSNGYKDSREKRGA